MFESLFAGFNNIKKSLKERYQCLTVNNPVTGTSDWFTDTVGC